MLFFLLQSNLIFGWVPVFSKQLAKISTNDVPKTWVSRFEYSNPHLALTQASAQANSNHGRYSRANYDIS